MSETDEKVCLCKYVSKETVQKAIDKGADTVDKIGHATGAGRGACKGTRCKQKLFEMIKKK
nr:(2Fe-2S)-binding protein [uncultured Cellulosilyticum sp.]